MKILNRTPYRVGDIVVQQVNMYNQSVFGTKYVVLRFLHRAEGLDSRNLRVVVGLYPSGECLSEHGYPVRLFRKVSQ